MRNCKKGKPCGRTCIKKTYSTKNCPDTCYTKQKRSTRGRKAKGRSRKKATASKKKATASKKKGWACVTPYGPGATTRQRVKSCKLQVGGQFKLRQACVERCNTFSNCA